MKKPCKKCGVENELGANSCSSCGVEHPGLTRKEFLKSMLRITILILVSIGIYNYFSKDENEYDKYRILSKETSLNPEKVSLTFEVGTDGKKPTEANLMYLAKAAKNTYKSTERVFVLFFLPGMEERGFGAYATGHSNPDTEVAILGNEPKNWCFGDMTYWHYELAMCITEKTKDHYLTGKKENDEFVELIDGEAQIFYETGVYHHRRSEHDMAEKYYKEAADKNHHVAVEQLIEIYKDKSPSEARMWREKSVKMRELLHEKGDIKSTLKLVELYRDGEEGIHKDYKRCLELLNYAIAKGSHGAYFMMGMAYKYGYFGLEKNHAKAQNFFETAKALGNGWANNHLDSAGT